MIDIHLDNVANSPREMLGVPTGFDEYDRQTGGAVPGRLKCIAATAKTGKSALALNMAKNISINSNVPVLYIDTEMPTGEQVDRLTSIVATELSEIIVPERAVSSGLYARNPKMKDAVDTAKEMIKTAPFYHVYMPDFTPEKIRNLARKFQRQHGIEWNGYKEKQFVLIFDYIKMPDEAMKGNVNEYLVLGQITSMLKNLVAGMLNIPVITFAQLNPRNANNIEDVNSSHMSGSNRIVMYVNELAFLRKKTDKELEQDGPENGNLVLELGETRNGGSYKGWIHYDIRRGVTSMTELRNVALSA
ncbi:Replicative DNA helicase [compost metagenome]